MARFIDSLPAPGNPREKKIIVLSLGRNGTLGLYNAFQMLGYQPYHFVTCFARGIPHMTIVIEGLRAKYFGEGKPFGRAEFDKWFADYDVLCDVPAFFAPELVEAYPEAKFILTHREPEAWSRSIHSTFVPLEGAKDRFPLWLMRRLEPFTRSFFEVTALISRVFWGERGSAETPEADRKLLQKYMEHNETVMRVTPPERLLAVKLEDGLGWEQICPFIGDKVPDAPYPRGNEPKNFELLANGMITQHWKEAFVQWTGVAVTAAVVGVWVWMRY